MDIKTEKESTSNNIMLPTNKPANNNIEQHSTAGTPSIPDFDTLYNELHSKFPHIINLDKPVLLAVGIRKEISKITGISSLILKKWIAKYFRKSNYYSLHKEGAKRYNLKGEESGIVTEQHQVKMNKLLEKMKNRKSDVKK